jgi:hypothetical protein
MEEEKRSQPGQQPPGIRKACDPKTAQKTEVGGATERAFGHQDDAHRQQNLNPAALGFRVIHASKIERIPRMTQLQHDLLEPFFAEGARSFDGFMAKNPAGFSRKPI